MAVSIQCYLIKRWAKQKYLLPFTAQMTYENKFYIDNIK